jgi:flagellin-like hook-associated protein FlgL
MGRIGASLSGIERALLNRLAESTTAATLNALHIATGKRINAPSDNPTTFVKLASYQSRLSNVTATMANVTKASGTVSQTQATLDAMRTQLETIRTELVKDEGRSLTTAQRAAAQASIDQALADFAELVHTDIDGKRLLDGSADFVVSGRKTSQVSGLTVYSTNTLGSSGVTRTISGEVLQAATQAQLTYTGSGTHPVADATVNITGNRGSASVTVETTDTIDQVAEKFNNESHKTGITASVSTVGPNKVIAFSTVDYGTDATMAITAATGAFAVSGGNGDGTDAGTNAIATINGHLHSDTTTNGGTVQGNSFDIGENGFHFEIEFAPGFTGDFDAMTVEGGGVSFALSTDLDYRSTLAIPGMQPALVGGLSGNLSQIGTGGDYAGLDGNTSRALRIVDEALARLTVVEGSVDGFQNAQVSSASGLLADLEEDLQDTIVATDGYNEKEEVLLLARNQELMSNAVSGLAILDQQRLSIVSLIKHIAGLD